MISSARSPHQKRVEPPASFPKFDAVTGPVVTSDTTDIVRGRGSTVPSTGRSFTQVWPFRTLALEADEPEAAILRLEAMPAELTEPAYLVAVGATIEAVFVICRVEGRVELLEARPDGARFRAVWS